MTVNGSEDTARIRKARTVAIVISVTMVLWLSAQFIGREMGLSARFVFLFDLAALAAFFWSLVVGLQLWRSRQTKE